MVEQWAKLLRIEACNDLTGERYTANVLIGCCDVCSTATAKRQRAFRLGQILFQPFTFFDKCHDACAGVVWRRFQRACDRANRFVTRYQPLACSLAGQGFYAAHARADRTFRYNLEDADIAGRLHMRTAAKLNGVIAPFTALAAHGKYAHLVAILFAEQRKRPGRNCIVRRHQTCTDLFVGANFLIHLGFHRSDVFLAQWLGMGKIEPEPIVGYQRALLCHMSAKPVTQRSVQQVGRRMVRADTIATIAIHLEMDGIADLDRSLGDGAGVRVQTTERFVRRLDRKFQALGCPDAPGIAGLAAAFAIERSLIGQDDDVVALLGRLHLGAILDDGDDGGFPGRRAVTGELCRALTFGNIEPDLFVRGLTRSFPCCACSSFLLRHRGVEAVLIDAYTAAAQCIFGKIVGKSVGVVELERGFAVESTALTHVFRCFIQQLETLVERAAELGFFAFENLLNQRLAADEFGIGLAHFRHQCRHQSVHQRFARPEKVGVTHRAAHYSAKNITAPFVGWQYTVGH